MFSELVGIHGTGAHRSRSWLGWVGWRVGVGSKAHGLAPYGESALTAAGEAPRIVSARALRVMGNRPRDSEARFAPMACRPAHARRRQRVEPGK